MSNSDPIEISAQTVNEAIQEALAKLAATEDDVVIEVLAMPRSGLLGLGARNARVRVTRRLRVEAASGVTAPPPAPLPQRIARTQTPEAGHDQQSLERSPEPRRARPPTERNERPERLRGPERPARGEAENRGGNPVRRTDDNAPRTPQRPVDVELEIREAREVLARILELIGEKGEITRVEGDPEVIELEIKGDGSGILIGRHGQTLDALEYLINRIVTRQIKDATPILLDTEAYRARRRQQLSRMALSLGEKTKREHQAVRMEPMPPRERRIIHLALKDDPMLTTRSVGDGFLRAVEIVPVQGPRGGSDEEPRRDRGRNRGREGDREHEDEQSPIGDQGGFKHGQKRLF